MLFKKMNIAALLLILGLSTVHAGSNPANTGLAFLKIGVGGRAVGVGEAYTAIANDASAAYWNPAGLAQLEHTEFLLTHNEWIQDVAHDFLGFTFNKGGNHFARIFSTSGDPIPIHTPAKVRA